MIARLLFIYFFWFFYFFTSIFIYSCPILISHNGYARELELFPLCLWCCFWSLFSIILLPLAVVESRELSVYLLQFLVLEFEKALNKIRFYCLNAYHKTVTTRKLFFFNLQREEMIPKFHLKKKQQVWVTQLNSAAIPFFLKHIP